MLFWIIIGALALATVGILLLGFRRGAEEAEPAAAYDLRVYRDQLAEVDRDLARGVLGEQDAQRVRTEIARRILAADAALKAETGEQAGARHNVAWMAAAGVVLIVGSTFLYLQLGAPGYGDFALQDRVAEARSLRESRAGQVEYVQSLVTDLKASVAKIEDEGERADLLARIDEVTAERRERIAELTARINSGETHATASDHVRLAATMVMAANGYVSPEAEAALSAALQLDPQNGLARFYWGLMLAQTGRPDQAFRIWDTLLRQGPADAPWIDPINSQIDELARSAGINNYVAPTPDGTRGPTSEDVEAAGAMSSAERMQMIEGMVSGLSERLASEGGTADEWAQLITALGVLGRTQEALTVYREARAQFDDQPAALDRIDAAGERAGVAN